MDGWNTVPSFFGAKGLLAGPLAVSLETVSWSVYMYMYIYVQMILPFILYLYCIIYMRNLMAKVGYSPRHRFVHDFFENHIFCVWWTKIPQYPMGGYSDCVIFFKFIYCTHQASILLYAWHVFTFGICKKISIWNTIHYLILYCLIHYSVIFSIAANQIPCSPKRFLPLKKNDPSKPNVSVGRTANTHRSCGFFPELTHDLCPEEAAAAGWFDQVGRNL